MLRRGQRELVSLMTKNEGYRFTEFELINEGQYEPTDADWNYKDVPHLTHIHKLVEGYPGYVGSDIVSSILVQKMFGLKFPAVLFNYQSGPNRQTYYITLFMYVLIVETSYESLGKNHTRVTTRYAIGCKSPLLALLFPLARFAIKRNYEDLMSGDIPMRARRGKLREWGYSFKGDNKPYSFFETSLIMESNVIPPPGSPDSKVHVFKPETMADGSSVQLGESDQYGLTVHRSGSTLNFFPRLCPHEGSDLSSTCDGKHAICPWHGRKFKPAFSCSITDLSDGSSKTFGDKYQIKKSGPNFEVIVPSLKSDSTSKAHSPSL